MLNPANNWTYKVQETMTQQYHSSEGLTLESGQQLPFYHLAYTVHGDLKNPVIWVFHAFTANADPTEWWSKMVGPGLAIDTNQYAVVCANMLGSCYGSSFAGSLEYKLHALYGFDFPILTNRDIVSAFEALRQHLNIDRIYMGIGASMGGQQLMEWSYVQPELFERMFLISTNARHSPWGIAFNEAQRMALMNGDFWSKPDSAAVNEGLRAARSVAMLSYRSYDAYGHTQLDENHVYDDFKASSYQQYQGLKLQRRFHPWAYYTLSKAMDSHNMARGRSTFERVLSSIRSITTICGVETDFLFPPSEQKYLASHIPEASFVEIKSNFGHDGFLVEYELLSTLIQDLLKK